MVLVHFNADSVEMENLPLAYFPYPRIEKIEITPSTFSFTEPSESQLFNVQISPADSWDKKVTWSLLHNDGNYGILDSDTYCYVYSRRNLKNESDSLVLIASSRDGEVQGQAVIYVPEVTGLEDLQINPGLKIYPNPANNIVTVETRFSGLLEIFSANGAKMLETQLNEGDNEIAVDSLPQGIYTLKIGENSERLIIQK